MNSDVADLSTELAPLAKMAESSPARTELLNVASSTIQRTNFPLPRELRDHIYSHLLDSRQLSYTPDFTAQDCELVDSYNTAHRYKFHTSILAVNHTIHEEASELLYKRNIFVVISYKVPLFNAMLEMSDVPIVSMTGIARFKHHSLRLHIKWRCPPWTEEISSDWKPQNKATVPLASCLMLAPDVPRLCRMLRWQLSFLPSDAIWVTSSPGKPLAAVLCHLDDLDMDCSVVPARIAMQLYGTRYRLSSSGLSEQLLAPFRTLVGGLAKVSIIGADTQLAYRLIRTMAPTVTWFAAYLWNNLELWAAMKHDADNCVLQGLFYAAELRYTSIIHVLRRECDMFPEDMVVGGTSVAEARVCTDALLCECGISLNFLHLRLGLQVFEEGEKEVLRDLCRKIGAASTSATLALTHAILLDRLIDMHDPLALTAVFYEMSSISRASHRDSHYVYDCAALARYLEEVMVRTLRPVNCDQITDMLSFTYANTAQ